MFLHSNISKQAINIVNHLGSPEFVVFQKYIKYPTYNRDGNPSETHKMIITSALASPYLIDNWIRNVCFSLVFSEYPIYIFFVAKNYEKAAAYKIAPTIDITTLRIRNNVIYF